MDQCSWQKLDDSVCKFFSNIGFSFFDSLYPTICASGCFTTGDGGGCGYSTCDCGGTCSSQNALCSPDSLCVSTSNIYVKQQVNSSSLIFRIFILFTNLVNLLLNYLLQFCNQVYHYRLRLILWFIVHFFYLRLAHCYSSVRQHFILLVVHVCLFL